jgi:integrative and conjugative element protein (TIGR02256 family)
MTHWFKRHPQYLDAATRALSDDKNYRQLHLKRGHLLVSHGNILVRLNEIHKFPFLIVYPNATPYALPVFYPLLSELAEEQIEQISQGSSEDISGAIKQQIRYYPRLRHQNSGGSLCILEWDNLDDGAKFYGMTTLLNRVKDWCKGTITGNFPMDSQEVELVAHFNHVERFLHLTYPEQFLHPALYQGEAYASLYTVMPKSSDLDGEYRNYMGILLTGTDCSGLVPNTTTPFPDFFQKAGIASELQLIEKKGLIQRKIEEKALIKMYWFHLTDEPTPFDTFEDLITLVGNGDRQKGIERMAPVLYDEIKGKPDAIFIAIRFPNRKELLEFQLFKVYKTGSGAGLLGCSPEETLTYLIDEYKTVFAVRSVELSDRDFHQRNAGRADREILRSRVVNLAGVGALGSEVADCLAKAGVGTLLLYDNQTMKMPNSVRHLAGIEYVGVAKVSAVKNELFHHNPFINVYTLAADITKLDLSAYFWDESISVSTIADDNTEAFLNERAVIANKVVYYARALRGGKVARIFRVIPGVDACFRCLQLYREEEKLFIPIAPDPQLPTLKNECNNPIRPASAADLKLIAALSARLILNELQHGFGKINHWLWSTEELEPLQPYQLHQQRIPPHPGCLYCAHENKSALFIDSRSLQFMQELVAQDPGRETGGVLAGYLDENGDIRITNASCPGPNAVCTAKEFKKDVTYCQKFLDELIGRSDGKITYVGEWHSHPSPNNKPSSTDINSLSEIAYQKEYLTEKPVMIILSSMGLPSATVHPMGKMFYYAALRTNDVKNDVLFMPESGLVQKK